METKEIVFDCEYVSQKEGFDKIPFGYIDKTVCGCGLTTLALTNDLDTIIAEPTIALVDNKVCQFDGYVFGVKGNVTTKEIEKYVFMMDSIKKPIKLMVTYDSFYKVKNYLDRCVIVIDESDQLLKYTKLKIQSKKTNVDVITELLNTIEPYKDKVSFISATPIPINYWTGNENWITTLDRYKLIFTNTLQVTPMLIHNNKPFNVLKNNIIRPIKEKGFAIIEDRKITKCIIFINSVENITKIIKDTNLDRNDVAILCGDSTRNDYKIMGYNRLDKPNKLPKYTFITSSGFEGIDLYDDDAMNIVVSNTSKECQMINMLTDLKQATSRQRNKNNPNYDRFIYIYNQDNFKMKDNEVLELIEKTRRQVIDNCSTLNEYMTNNV
jgi:hypothetical protein